MVEQRSPKPLVACSNRVSPAKLPCFRKASFFAFTRFSTQPCVSLRIHVACDVRKSNASILAHYSVASLLAIVFAAVESGVKTSALRAAK